MQFPQSTSSGEHFDLIVLGGGVSGLGVMKAAADLGIRALLLEKASIAGATSNNSLRIIHGGFRYLQTLNLKRVVESLRAQNELLRLYPDLVQPLDCLMPLADSGLKSRIPVAVGLASYKLIRSSVLGSKTAGSIISADQLHALLPAIGEEGRNGAVCWQDALMINPLQLASRIVEYCKQKQAQILEHYEVAEVEERQKQFVVKCVNQQQFSAPVVINCLGPWIRQLKTPFSSRPLPWPKTWCKAFNVVVNKQLHPSIALGINATEGRLFFIVPRDNGSVIGTGQLAYEPQDLSQSPQIEDEDLQTFLTQFNQALPQFSLSLSDVKNVEVGILPAIEVSAKTQRLYGSAQIARHGGYLELMSTKYTTFLPQGREILKYIRQ